MVVCEDTDHGVGFSKAFPADFADGRRIILQPLRISALSAGNFFPLNSSYQQYPLPNY